MKISPFFMYKKTKNKIILGKVARLQKTCSENRSRQHSIKQSIFSIHIGLIQSKMYNLFTV